MSASSVSKSDLERRLVQKGESKQDADKAVEWMSQMGLLDDVQTGRQVVQHCIAKGYGLARAKQALYEKQIPKEYWDALLEDYPDQTDKILSYLSSHLGSSREQKDIRRVTDALLRRGHSYARVRKALQQYLEDWDPLEDEYG
jgi:regulatory protein